MHNDNGLKIGFKFAFSVDVDEGAGGDATAGVGGDATAGAGGDATAGAVGDATAVSTDAQAVSAGTASEEWRFDLGFPQRAAYCICKKAKETCENDDMVTCSNEDCQNRAGKDNVNWFHYACVKFNPSTDKEFFCTQTCKEKFLKETRKRKRG